MRRDAKKSSCTPRLGRYGRAAMNAAEVHAPNHRASLDECYAHTDLRWRLERVPETAACRGQFLNTLDQRAGELGEATRAEYRRFFQTYRFSLLKFYPVRDYLTRIVLLSQIHFGANEIYRGVREIQAAAYPAWKSTLFGRAMFAMLGSDFATVLKAIDRTYATNSFVNYCKFGLENPLPKRFVAHFHPEYLWIEHAMLGALEGVARACNARVQFEVDLDDPFNGRIAMTVE
jgi:uncharacterized protein (TIGR02265 family)